MDYFIQFGEGSSRLSFRNFPLRETSRVSSTESLQTTKGREKRSSFESPSYYTPPPPSSPLFQSSPHSSPHSSPLDNQKGNEEEQRTVGILVDILKDLTFQNLKQYPETKEASVSILLRAIDSLQGLKNSAQLAAEEREKRGKKMREKEEIKGEEQEENRRVESDKEERKNEIEAEETKLEKEEKKERRKKLPKMESVLCLNHFSVVPICRMSQEKKSLFLQNEWLPFLSRLRLELMQIQTRSLVVAKPHILPPQKQILSLADECFDLTEKWYGFGRGNISALYEWFIAASEWSGEGGYHWKKIRRARSPDSYILCVDGVMRRKAYDEGRKGGGKGGGAKASKKLQLLTELKTSDRTKLYGTSKYIGIEGPNHQAFESPIDNTVLSNVMSPFDARLLISGKIVKNFLLFFIAYRQKKWMRWLYKVERWGNCPYDEDKGASSSVVKSSEVVTASFLKWAALNNGEELKKVGIDVESFSFTALLQPGTVTDRIEKLDSEHHEKLHELVEKKLRLSMLQTKRTCAKDLLDFLEWCQAHPGKVYNNNPRIHKKLLLLGLMQNQLVIVKRSTMESVTVHRYIPVTWVRAIPLVTIENGEEKTVRSPGDGEHSRFRKNSFPYGDSHGMGIAGGGLVEGTGKHGSLRYEYGTAFSSDPSAKVSNWFLSDIEKICRECEILNPPAHRDLILPGEAFHEVGQNPKAASSIGATQHTQISRSSVEDWPLLMMKNNPKWIPSLKCELDIIQVGNSPDAFFIKFVTKQLTSPSFLKSIYHLRLHLMRKLDSLGSEEAKGRGVDFVLHAQPIAQSDGVTLFFFQPISPLQKVNKGGRLIEQNLDTGETFVEADSPIPNIGSFASHGNLLISEGYQRVINENGREMMASLFDFVRKPGARAVAEEFLLRRYGYSWPSGRLDSANTYRLSAKKESIFGASLETAAPISTASDSPLNPFSPPKSPARKSSPHPSFQLPPPKKGEGEETKQTQKKVQLIFPSSSSQLKKEAKSISPETKKMSDLLSPSKNAARRNYPGYCSPYTSPGFGYRTGTFQSPLPQAREEIEKKKDKTKQKASIRTYLGFQ